MRKIIDGKKYDTETATLVGSYSPNANRRDFQMGLRRALPQEDR
jgi:hypothetical protein